MSEEGVYNHPPTTQDYGETATPTEPEAVEKSDRGLFGHFGKKEEENKCEEEAAISSDFHEKVHVSESEPKHEEKKEGEGFFQKLHRSSSSSSSSSEEEYEEDGEKKRRKKPLKEKIKEKFEKKESEDTTVPIETYEAPPSEVSHPIPTPEAEEKKGFLDKIKEKLPGGHKKEEHAVAPPAPTAAPEVAAHEEDKEKKGILEKIKEKIPGYHSKSEEEKEKEKAKDCD